VDDVDEPRLYPANNVKNNNLEDAILRELEGLRRLVGNSTR
jgi:hypothetical protein